MDDKTDRFALDHTQSAPHRESPDVFDADFSANHDSVSMTFPPGPDVEQTTHADQCFDPYESTRLIENNGEKGITVNGDGVVPTATMAPSDLVEAFQAASGSKTIQVLSTSPLQKTTVVHAPDFSMRPNCDGTIQIHAGQDAPRGTIVREKDSTSSLPSSDPCQEHTCIVYGTDRNLVSPDETTNTSGSPLSVQETHSVGFESTSVIPLQDDATRGLDSERPDDGECSMQDRTAVRGGGSGTALTTESQGAPASGPGITDTFAAGAPESDTQLLAMDKTHGLSDAEMKWFWQDNGGVGSRGSSRMAWDEGDVIEGIYEVRQVINEGGMGAIYIVFHTAWNRLLVMKSPKPEIMGNPENVKRYIDEATAWISLGLHPNIASCYYVREIDGMPRIFIEYADSGSLKEWIRAGKVSDWKTILDFTIQFCEGLSYAHERIDAHRDIKPANCLIAGNNLLKITDFGLVKIARPLALDSMGRSDERKIVSAGVTETGQGMGTPPYMPPEQWKDSSRVGREADMYAFAVMLYEMCCGRKPFEVHRSHTLKTFREFVCSTPAPDPCAFRKDMASPLREFLLRNLSKKAADRDRSFKDARIFFRTLYEDIVGEPYPRPSADTMVQIADSCNNKGVSLYDLGNLSEAESAFHEARTHDPQHIEAIFNLSSIQCMRHKMDYPEMYQLVSNAMRVSHKEQIGERLLGEISAKSGNLERAESHLKAAPRDLHVLEMLGHVYVGMERYDEAFEMFSAALKEGAGRAAALGLATSLSARCLPIPGELMKKCALSPDMEIKEAYKGWSLPHLHLASELRGHEEGIKRLDVALGPQRLLSSSHDRTLRLWDLETEMCIRVLDNVDVECIALSPDACLAATGNYEGVISVYDLLSGEMRLQFKGHREWINCIAVTPDGRHILSGSEDRTIAVHAIENGESVRTFDAHDGSVRCLKITPDGAYIISGGNDGQLRVFNLDSGKLELALEGNQSPVHDVAVVHQGAMFLSLTESNTIFIWAAAAGRIVGRIDKVEAECLCATTNGHFVLTGGPDEKVRIRNRHTGQCLRVLEGHSASIRAMVLAGNNKLVTGSYDCSIRLWSLKRIQRLGTHSFTAQLNFPVNIGDLLHRKQQFLTNVSKAQTALSEDDFWTAYDCITAARAVSGYERRPEVLDLLQQYAGRFVPRGLHGYWMRHKLVEANNRAGAVSIDPAGSVAVVAVGTGLQLWNTASGELLNVLTGHESDIRALSIAGNHCVSLAGDETLRIWDLNKQQIVKTIDGARQNAFALVVDAEGRIAFTGDRDGGLAQWDLATGRRSTLSRKHSTEITCITITSNGRYLVTGGQDKTLCVWDINSGHCDRMLTGHKDQIRCAAMHPNNQFLASGAGGFSQSDYTIRIWDIASGKNVRVLQGHQGWVDAVAFTQDGRFVVSASRDHTVRVWDVIDSRCVAVIDGHNDQVNCMALGGRGRFVVSSSRHDSLIIWELDWDYNLEKPNKHFSSAIAR